MDALEYMMGAVDDGMHRSRTQQVRANAAWMLLKRRRRRLRF